MPQEQLSDEMRELIERLRQAVIDQGEVISEYEDLIAQLTAPPYKLALVLREHTDVPDLSAYKRGMKVLVKTGPNAGEYGKLDYDGVDGDGDVYVNFRKDGMYYKIVRHGQLVNPPPIRFAKVPPISTVTVQTDGGMMDVGVPDGMFLEQGDWVLLGPSGQIVKKANLDLVMGEMANVVDVNDDETWIEVAYQGATRLVLPGKKRYEIEPGDRVILDFSGRVILENLGPDEKAFSYAPIDPVSWEDVGGQAEAKAILRSAIEMRFTNARLYRFYNKKDPKGFVLHSGPGMGKTLLAKAVATAQARLAGHDDVTGFFFISGPELKNMYYGNTEAAIRQVFARARRYMDTNGRPCVIFFDEADSMFPARSNSSTSAADNSVVGQMLSMMNGAEETGAIVLFATNRLDMLDPALIRDQRVNRLIELHRPTREDTVDLFSIHLRDIPFQNGYDIDDIATWGAETVFDETLEFCKLALSNSKQYPLRFSDMNSGALVAGVVERAVQIAMERDIANGTMTGVSLDDIAAAVHQSFAEKSQVFQEDLMHEVERRLKTKVVRVIEG